MWRWSRCRLSFASDSQTTDKPARHRLPSCPSCFRHLQSFPVSHGVRRAGTMRLASLFCRTLCSKRMAAGGRLSRRFSIDGSLITATSSKTRSLLWMTWAGSSHPSGRTCRPSLPPSGGHSTTTSSIRITEPQGCANSCWSGGRLAVVNDLRARVMTFPSFFGEMPMTGRRARSSFSPPTATSPCDSMSSF